MSDRPRRRDRHGSPHALDASPETAASIPPEAQVKPHLTMLSPEQIATIHEAALRILREVGLRVDSPRARAVYAKGGASIRIVENRVFFEPEIVDWSISTVPASIDVYNRRGEHKFTLGTDQPTRFGAGVTNLYFQDPIDNHL